MVVERRTSKECLDVERQGSQRQRLEESHCPFTHEVIQGIDSKETIATS